ncbi:uncharacterized protein [Battus philenor]|uniref:uncharacterized protein n=1 Tax=Battus philenor TaxID=42288 RepID=UPI0035CE8CB4
MNSLFILFLYKILFFWYVELKLIDKSIILANEIFDHRQATCVAWWNSEPDDVNRFLSKFSASVVTCNVTDIAKQTDFHNFVKYKQTVLFVKNPEEFKYFLNSVIKDVVNPISIILVLTAVEKSNSVLLNLTRLAWKNDISNIIIISANGNNDNVTFTTYLPHSDGKCDNFNPVTLNTNENKHFGRKFKNFQRCPIRITDTQFAPYMVFKTNANNEAYVSGIDGDVLSLVIERLNATIEIVASPPDNDRAITNSRKANAFRNLIDGKAEIMSPKFTLNYKRYILAQVSYVYGSYEIVWCLPESREIYAWAKVFLPFLTNITLLLAFAFITIIITIMIINKFITKETQIKKVFFDILGIFFGQPASFITKCRLKNSIYVLWIWFCLIIRVIYHSDLVERFERTIYEPRLTTVNEALDTVEGYGGFLELKEFYRNTSFETNFQAVTLSDYPKYLEQIANGKRFLLATNELFLRYFNYSVHILEERVTSIPVCFLMRPRWPAASELDKLIERVTEAGFVNKIIRQYVEKRSCEAITTEKDIVKPIELSVLGACFYGLLIMYFICTIILVLEILHDKVQCKCKIR